MLYLYNENMWNHLGPLQIHGIISIQLNLCQHCISKHWAVFSVYPLLKSASRSNISCKREDTQPCYMYFGNSFFPFRQKLGNNPRIKVISSCILLSLFCIRHLLSTHFQNFHTISASSQTSQARSSGHCISDCSSSIVLRCLGTDLLFNFWGYMFLDY